MSESALKVFHELTSAGLLSSDSVTRYGEEIESGADALLDRLVVEKIITAYQCEKFKKGQVGEICFGDYIVITELGRGGMGTVLLARHRVMDRKVAIKVLPVTALDSPSAVARFYQEVKVAGKLTHSNIVHAYDAREHHGFHYLVMEYVDGHDLAQVVNEIGPLPLSLAIDYIKQAAQGLEYAHGENVVHRDIKPSNLLLDKQGVVKVLDMGLARVGTGDLNEQSLHLTTTGQVMGTVEFMSPEQAEDTRLADARSDIYSLGCTLYRLLANRGPYSRDTVVKTILAHRGDPIPQLPSTGESMAGAQRIFEKMIAKKPEDRYQNVSMLLEDLDRIDQLDDESNAGHGLVDANMIEVTSGRPPSTIPPSPMPQSSSPISGLARPPIAPLTSPSESFSKTAIAVRINDDAASSAVSSFNQLYESSASQPNVGSSGAVNSATGYPEQTIVDLSKNSSALIPPGSTSDDAPVPDSDVFYIGEEKSRRGIYYMVASLIALLFSCLPFGVSIIGVIANFFIWRFTKANIQKISDGQLIGGKGLLRLAKLVSIVGFVIGIISFVSNVF